MVSRSRSRSCRLRSSPVVPSAVRYTAPDTVGSSSRVPSHRASPCGAVSIIQTSSTRYGIVRLTPISQPASCVNPTGIDEVYTEVPAVWTRRGARRATELRQVRDQLVHGLTDAGVERHLFADVPPRGRGPQ